MKKITLNVCVWERERDIERETVNVCVCEKERDKECVRVCACEWVLRKRGGRIRKIVWLS